MSPLQHCNRASWRIKFFFGMLAACMGSANAEELAVSLEARVWIVGPDGARHAVAAQRAGPGELIEYRATYRNTGKRVLKQVQATLPVPANTTLVIPPGAGKQAWPPSASRDGQRFDATPLQQMVRGPDGSVQAQPLPLAAYRYLRWPLGDLPAGQSRTVSAQVRVVSAAEPARSQP